MATKEHTFDLSAKVNVQELKNATEQTKKEILTRYDFKADKIKEIELDEKNKNIIITASSDNKVQAIKDILDSKLIKRDISLKTLHEEKRETVSGGNLRVIYTIKDTLSPEDIKYLQQLMKKAQFKATFTIIGSEIRFKSKSIDELQAIIAYLKGSDIDSPLCFSNFK